MAVQAGTFSILANKVMFASKFNLLYKATADNESPTPGYMFQEIINISNESGSHCMDLLSVLVDRLKEDSCNVKLKVLRIMKHVVQKGHPDFTSALRKKSRGIQAASKHSGPPDPLHGNVPYLLVRKEAQVLLSILFEVKEDQQVSFPQGQQMPSGSISSVGIGSMGNAQGFGNTPATKKSLTESFISGLKDVAEKVFDPHPQGRDVRPRETQQTFSQYKPLTLANIPVETSMESSTVKQETQHARPARKTVPHEKGRAGGGWEDEEVVLGAPTQHFVVQKDEEQFVGVADNNAEERLAASWLEVDENSSPLPTRQAVVDFVKQCATLNCDKICMLLATSLKDNREAALMRSMLALERLLHLEMVAAERMAASCAQELLRLYKMPKGPVQSKARLLLRLLEKQCNPQVTLIPLHSNEHLQHISEQQKDCETQEKGFFDVSTPALDGPPLKVPFAQ